MAEETEIENQKATQYRRYFSHLAPRSIAFAETLHRFLESEYGTPIETGTGTTQQLIYHHNGDGTIITFEVTSVGVTIKGLECRVGILFVSNDRKSIDKITSRKVWDHFDLEKSLLAIY